MQTLSVSNFAHIASAKVPLSDLVVLVGPQATGKSLILQLLKLVKDRNRIATSLRKHGFAWETGEEWAPLFFGSGFERSWKPNETEVSLGRINLTLNAAAASRKRSGEDSVFYIPAHRTLTIAEGWPRSFLQFQIETPFVVRRFSEDLLELLNRGLGGNTGKIFPQGGRLKAEFRRTIDEAVFHGASLKLEVRGARRQFMLDYEDASIPYMSWTAGQREFIPLLLGFYHLLTAGKVTKRAEIEWVIIEEPEMGLHPKATVAVMASVLELLQRGYRVALSTHSPTVLDIIWAMDRLKPLEGGARSLAKILSLSINRHVLATLETALRKDRTVVYLNHDSEGRVHSKNITGLSPSSPEEAESGWGGLTQFSARAARVVSEAVNQARSVSR